MSPLRRSIRQKNVPKPKKLAGADEKSLKGLHLSIAFAVAATQYAYNTGDYSCWSKALCRNQNAITSLRKRKERLDKTREGTSGQITLRSDYTLTEESPRLKAMANTNGIVNLSLNTVNSRLLTVKLSTNQTMTMKRHIAKSLQVF